MAQKKDTAKGTPSIKTTKQPTQKNKTKHVAKTVADETTLPSKEIEKKPALRKPASPTIKKAVVKKQPKKITNKPVSKETPKPITKAIDSVIAEKESQPNLHVAEEKQDWKFVEAKTKEAHKPIEKPAPTPEKIIEKKVEAEEIVETIQPEIFPEVGVEEPKTAPLMDLTAENVKDSLLMECAWEVCNQVGGIYTVIQTKVPATKLKWGDNYLLIGPYFAEQTAANFEYDQDLYNEEKIKENTDPIQEVVRQMHSMGYDVHYGTWLIDGRPKAVLFNPKSLLPKIHEHKYIFWEHHNITLPGSDALVDQVVSFGFMVYEFIKLLSYNPNNKKQLIAHFHEWMAGIPIPELRRNNINTKIVFTTHATMLGRYLAMNDPQFYDHLPFYDWQKEASHFNISHIVQVERAASHGAHIFSTVSDITANECKYLLGREPEAILPNGLNIKRFEVMHEFQQIHKQTKGKINDFIMGNFFHNYTFDLDKTLYFFTSGRFEYFNKGFDLTLQALTLLNRMMKEEGIDKTVVMFFITKKPYHSINSGILESRAQLEEIRRNCDDIQEVLAEKLFNEMLERDDTNHLPNLNDLVDDYLALRLRRNIGSWRGGQMPAIVTHDLVNEHEDPIMNYLKSSHLLNYREDKVKVVYHPDFVSTANPLFRMDYLQFVRGCHLGIFPSYYEPWGYTPLECCASGLPSITTDLAGFGSYVKNHVTDSDEKGLWVIDRRNRPTNEVVEDIARKLLEFVKLDRRERIALRNNIEDNSTMFGWRQLRKYYDNAYAKVLSL